MVLTWTLPLSVVMGCTLAGASASAPSSSPNNPIAAHQDSVSPQQKLMARRAAELDAYRLLAEQVLGVELQGQTTVEDFVTSRDDIRSRVDAILRGARIVAVRSFSDGTAEVDAELTVRQVVEELRKIRDEVYKDGSWKTEDFEEIVRKTNDTIIRVTGSGAARPESVVPDPATEPIIGARPGSETREVKLPPIYSKYPPSERLKAKRAAELDAYRKLLERINGLALSAGTKVGDFVTESDTIRTAVEGRLRGARIESVRYGADGVVEVQMSMTIEQVVETVKKVRDEKYEGGRWKTEEFDDIRKNTVRKVVTVLGTGALATGGRPVAATFDDGDPEVVIVDP
jgi:hypothetical protein